MPKQLLGSQRDFSFGEVDASLKRNDDHPARKAGMRQLANARILNSSAFKNRPGRRALQIASTRTDEITIAPGLVFRFNFTVDNGGTLKIFDINGSPLVAQNALGFNTTAKIQSVNFAVLQSSVFIAGSGFQPLVVTWNGATWSGVAVYNGATTAGGQRRRFFYRISPKGITMFPSAATGNITVQFSANILVAGHVGTLMRYIGRQFLITGINTANNCNATVIEPLPGSQIMTVGADPRTIFNIGDEVIGSVSDAKGEVIGLTSTQVDIQLLSAQSTSASTIPSQSFGGLASPSQISGFVPTDILAGPGGSLAATGASAIGGPNAIEYWDEEVMNNLQGWPAAVFADQNRVGLCNFPSVPNGIGWSAISNPTDQYVGSNPGDAMFELAPDKVQVFYVLAGAESSEFVFCDRKVYYIPISVTNPLSPGRVAFNIVSGSGSLAVQPRIVDQDIVYVASNKAIMAITAPGNYYRPYETRNITEFSTHLIKTPIAIAAPTQTITFSETYFYVLNTDGSIAVAKYKSAKGEIALVGWSPWSSAGTVNWISARDDVVLFTTNYPGASIVEMLDDTVYLDAALFVNAVPAALAPAVGLGPLWWQAGQTVALMDQGTRFMGLYQVDANGNIVPQQNGGENLALASLVAGQSWTMKAEPFSPEANPGTDEHQRMTLRQISQLIVSVIESTGFVLAALFCSRQTPTSPPLGTITATRRVPAYNQGDDATKPPLQRETIETWPVPGSSYDPRAAIIKDTPGPLLIAEIGMEISI